MSQAAVVRTVEFARIEKLPRRKLSYEQAVADAARLTTIYARPGSGAELRPWQGYCLEEVAKRWPHRPKIRGLWGALPVGTGKTLYLELVPVHLWPGVKPGHTPAAMILVPSAGLRDKTYADRRKLGTEWRLANPSPSVWTLQSLATAGNAKKFWEICPAVIEIDEADSLSNPDSSVFQRLWRYVEDVRSGKVVPKGLPSWAPPEVVVVWVTGTPSRNTITAYTMQLVLALDEGAPVPRNREEQAMWGLAINNKGQRGRGVEDRADPGPMGRDLHEARAWFASRLAETPGVVIVDEDSAADIPLTVKQVLPRECRAIDEACETFATTGMNPGGIPVATPLDRWRFENQIGCGFYSKWKDPQPPEPWKQARRAFAKFCMAIIESTHEPGFRGEPLDTEAQVVKRYWDAEEIQEWLAIEPTYTPVEEVVWISDATIRSVADWTATLRPDEAAIVWTGAVELGHRIADHLACPYYGRGGLERKTKRPLHAAHPFEEQGRLIGAGGRVRGVTAPRPTRDRIMTLSWQANMKGFNLQPYTRQLIVFPPPSAKWLEQMVGRSHRPRNSTQTPLDPTAGVQVDFMMTSGCTWDLFGNIHGEASFARETGHPTQKLLRAEIITIDPPTTKAQAMAQVRRTGITPANAFRWARRSHGSALPRD